jgi:hypothetical protein
MSFIKNLLVLGCVFSACAKPPEHVKITQDSIKSFSKHLEKTTALKTIGSGGFYFGKSVEGFYIDFEFKEVENEFDAEKLLRNTVNSMICHLNSDEKIKSLIKNSNITASQISLSIGFLESNRKPSEKIAQVHLDHGYIHYSVFVKEKNEYACYKRVLY